MSMDDQARALRELVQTQMATLPAPKPPPGREAGSRAGAGGGWARPQPLVQPGGGPSGKACRARLMAVIGGRPGGGRTVLSVALASLWAASGREVVLVDADPRGRDAMALSGIGPLMAPEPGQLMNAVPGYAICTGMLGRDVLADLAAGRDVLVLDTGRTPPEESVPMVTADRHVVVLTPKPMDIVDSFALVQALASQRRQLDLRVVVNRTNAVEEGRKVFTRFDGLCRRYLAQSCRYAGRVREDSYVTMASEAHRGFMTAYPRCPAARDVRAVSRGLISHGESGRGFWHQMMTWWRGVATGADKPITSR